MRWFNRPIVCLLYFSLQLRLWSYESLHLREGPLPATPWYSFLYKDSESDYVVQEMAREVYHWQEEDLAYRPAFFLRFKTFEKDTEESKEDRRLSFLSHKTLTFLNRRLERHWKEAEEGSPLAGAYHLKESLSSGAQWSDEGEIFPFTLKVRLRAKVLEGMAILSFDNPYIISMLNISLRDGVEFYVGKELASEGLLADVRYTTRWELFQCALSQRWGSGVQGRVVLAERRDETKVEVGFSMPTALFSFF